jgi:hypothetical protein
MGCSTIVLPIGHDKRVVPWKYLHDALTHTQPHTLSLTQTNKQHTTLETNKQHSAQVPLKLSNNTALKYP